MCCHCLLFVLLVEVWKSWWFSDSFQLTARIVLHICNSWYLSCQYCALTLRHPIAYATDDLEIICKTTRKCSFPPLFFTGASAQFRPWQSQLCCTIGAHPLLWSWIPWCPEIVCGWVSKYPERSQVLGYGKYTSQTQLNFINLIKVGSVCPVYLPYPVLVIVKHNGMNHLKKLSKKMFFKLYCVGYTADHACWYLWPCGLGSLTIWYCGKMTLFYRFQ